jgi:hypothetical protein
MQQVQPQEREQYSLWPCNIVIAPLADVKTSSMADDKDITTNDISTPYPSSKFTLKLRFIIFR